MLWGDGSPTREFLYVDDCADGLVLAAERYDGAEPVNLGTGVETSIRELAETIADLTGFEGEIVWDTSMPNGQPRRQLDATRARELFGFEAQTPAPRRPRDRRSPGTGKAPASSPDARCARGGRGRESWRRSAVAYGTDGPPRPSRRSCSHPLRSR